MLAKSTFRQDHEGWTATFFGSTPTTAQWSHTDGGDPEPAIVQYVNNASDYYFWWGAPAKFLGNKRAAYKGSLRFEQSWEKYNNDADPIQLYVYLGADLVSGAGRTMIRFDLPKLQPDASPDLTSFAVPLKPAGWHDFTGDTDHGEITAELMKSVLGHLAELDIEAHDPNTCATTIVGICRFVLDNVKLIAPR